REVVDEVDGAGLDLLVQAGPDQLVDDRPPAGDGSGGQVGVQRLPVVPLLGRVHLQAPATGVLSVDGRDADALVPVLLAGHVVVVRQHVRAAGDVEVLLVPAGEPGPAVGVGRL